MLRPTTARSILATFLTLLCGSTSLLLAAEAETAIAASTPQASTPLPGLISNPPLLSGNRRWQMFCKNPGLIAGAVDWSPDGRWLAMATGRAVRLFEMNGAPEFQKILVGHGDFIRAVRFSPGGELIATASLDGTVRIWDREGRVQRTYGEHEDAVHDVAWHPNGQRLASASADGTVRIWSIDGNTIATLSDHEAPVNAVAWSPDGKILASGCQNKVIRYWSPDGEKGPVAEGHIGSVRSLAWNFDGSQLLSCDLGIEASDNTKDDIAHVKVWNTQGEQVNSLTIDAPLTHVCWSPDGKRALAGGSMGFWIWTVAERRPPVRGALRALGVNVPVAWRPSGDLIITGTQLQNPNAFAVNSIPLRNIQLTSVAQSPDQSLLGVGRTGGSFSLYSIEGKQTYSLTTGQRGQSVAFYWSPDGTSFIPLQRLAPTIQQYDPTGKALGQPIRLPTSVRSGDWSRDGKYFAAGGDGMTVILVDLEAKTATQIGKQAHGITQVRFTPDQQQICSTGFDGCVRFWSRDGKPGKVFEAIATSIRGLALANDGKLLATGTEDGTIRFWTIEGESETTVGGHGGYVETLDFDPTGTLLASGSWDHTVRIWKRDGSPVSVLRGHEGGVYGVQWSHDGRHLFSCGDDGTVRMWNAGSGETEWQSLLGEGGGYVTMDAHGHVKYGDEKILETDFVFFAEDEQGRLAQTPWASIRTAVEPPSDTVSKAE